MKEKYKNNRCLCGSGKTYIECCKGKIDPNLNEGIHKKFMQEIDQFRNKYNRLCLHPKQDECCKIKTHAHTISQQAVLSLIAENGNVLMPILFGITNEFNLEPTGIKSKATKFYCFCQLHDAMFYPIDHRSVELSEHNFFLYAYRTFASTYYKVKRELCCYNALYQKYDLTSNPLQIAYNLQTKNLFRKLNKYKDKFDKAINTEIYDCLKTVTITLNYQVYFAAATCFCPLFNVFGNHISYSYENDLPMIYISIIPNENQTRIIFSWFKGDIIDNFFNEQLKVAPTRLILKYLNNLIPLNCENLAISPLLWKKWDTNAQNDFKSVAHGHLINENIKKYSKIYFRERAYNLFSKL